MGRTHSQELVEYHTPYCLPPPALFCICSAFCYACHRQNPKPFAFIMQILSHSALALASAAKQYTEPKRSQATLGALKSHGLLNAAGTFGPPGDAAASSSTSNPASHLAVPGLLLPPGPLRIRGKHRRVASATPVLSGDVNELLVVPGKPQDYPLARISASPAIGRAKFMIQSCLPLHLEE